MSKATMTIEGFVAADPELRNTQGGKAVTNVTVPHTARRKNQQGQFEDVGETLWVEASFWERDAEAITAQVRKGTLVTVTGTPELKEFQRRDGGTGSKLTLSFATLGIIPRADASSNGAANTYTPAPATQASTEPWATPGSYDDSSPF